MFWLIKTVLLAFSVNSLVFGLQFKQSASNPAVSFYEGLGSFTSQHHIANTSNISARTGVGRWSANKNLGLSHMVTKSLVTGTKRNTQNAFNAA